MATGPASTIGRGLDRGLFTRTVEPLEPTRTRGTVVWIHGLGESALSFERALVDPRLAAWGQLAPDLPGYGDTPRPPRPLSFAEHVETLVAWLDGRDLGRLVVIGHSMGGVLGLMLAERLGPAVAGFVNVEGNLSEGDCSFSGRTRQAGSLEVWLASGFAATLELVREQDDAAHRLYLRSLEKADPKAFYANGRELVALSETRTPLARQAALSVPSVYFAGAAGGASSTSLALLRAGDLPWIPFAGAGHWIYVDQLEAFGAALAGFLAGLAVSPRNDGSRGEVSAEPGRPA